MECTGQLSVINASTQLIKLPKNQKSKTILTKCLRSYIHVLVLAFRLVPVHPELPQRDAVLPVLEDAFVHVLHALFLGRDLDLEHVEGGGHLAHVQVQRLPLEHHPLALALLEAGRLVIGRRHCREKLGQRGGRRHVALGGRRLYGALPSS